MIKAYDEDWFLSVNPHGQLRDHIQETLMAQTPARVKAALFEYLVDQDPAPAVYNLLNRLASDSELLPKLQVVTDRQWGTCTIHVTPAEARLTAGGVQLLDGSVDEEATLRYWARHAEAVLIQLDEAPSAADSRKPLLESLQWLTHWQFKRQFDRVLGEAAN